MSSRPDVYMPLFIGDYLAGTSRLTTELHGAYLLLIMDYWMNGPLPDNDQMLASIAKMNPDAWSIARESLKHYFSISDGQWRHKRIDQELSTATEKKAQAAEKARKAAEARWSNQGNNAPSNATSIKQALLEECPSPSPSPIIKNTLVDTGVSTDSSDDSNTDKPPSCPHAEIIAAYHEILPELDSVVVSLWKPNTKRYKWLQARWRESDKHQSVEFWRRFFKALRNYPFYLGTNDRCWKANLEWMVKQENFIKLIEKFRSDAKRQ